MITKATPSRSQIAVGRLLKKYNLKGKDDVYIELEDSGNGSGKWYFVEIKRQAFK